MTKEERKLRSDIRFEIQKAKKMCEEANYPFFAAVQIGEDLITDALLPEELEQVDYHKRYLRMMAGASDFNITDFK